MELPLAKVELRLNTMQHFQSDILPMFDSQSMLLTMINSNQISATEC